MEEINSQLRDLKEAIARDDLEASAACRAAQASSRSGEAVTAPRWPLAQQTGGVGVFVTCKRTVEPKYTHAHADAAC
jgi:hypothetical protein